MVIFDFRFRSTAAPPPKITTSIQDEYSNTRKSTFLSNAMLSVDSAVSVWGVHISRKRDAAIYEYDGYGYNIIFFMKVRSRVLEH